MPYANPNELKIIPLFKFCQLSVQTGGNQNHFIFSPKTLNYLFGHLLCPAHKRLVKSRKNNNCFFILFQNTIHMLFSNFYLNYPLFSLPATFSFFGCQANDTLSHIL